MTETMERNCAGKLGLFSYDPLPTPTSIRALDVSPELGTGKRISCNIKIIDLDDSPDYCTLSYTWGDPGANPNDEQYPSVDKKSVNGEFEIMCDGLPFKVTKNCYAFLVMLRRSKLILSQSPPTEPELVHIMTVGLIWIDAICINQNSLEERSAQVRMMDRIYRQAQKVIIWLGPSDSMTKPALNAIHKFSTASTDVYNEVYGRSISNPEPYEKLGIPMISKDEWLAVLALYNRSWFSRAWTVQEYALAREAVLQCGSIMIQFDAVSYAARVMSLIGWDFAIQMLGIDNSTEEPSTSPPNANIEVKNGRKLYKKMLFAYPLMYLGYLREIQDHPWHESSSKEQWEKEGGMFPLQAVLSATSDTSCLNPVDKIYSSLGLIPEANWQGIPIDYSMPAEEVFIQTTRALMTATNSLSMLSFVQDKLYRNIRGLPSWVPDYTALRTIMPLDWGGNPGMHPIPGFRWAFYNSSHGMPFSMDSPGTALSKLSVKGIFYSTVQKTATFNREKLYLLEPLLDVITALPQDWLWRSVLGDERAGSLSDDLSPLRQPAPESDGKIFEQYLFDNVFDLLRKTQAELSDYTDDKEKSQAVSYALREYAIYKMLIGSTFSPTHTQLVWFDWKEYSLRWIQEPKDLGDGYEVEGLKQLKDADSRVLIRFNTSVVARMTERVLFTTESCKLGIGLVSVQPKDEIWILAGAKVPYVLRPKGGGEYELVGEAYVHDVMHGEFVKERKDETRDIVLV